MTEERVCPQCKAKMKLWQCMGGRMRWECPDCKYEEEI